MLNYRKLSGRLARDLDCFGGVRLWLAFRALPTLLLAGMLALLLWVSPVRSMPGEVGAYGPGEVESGMLLLRGGDGTFVPALVHASKAHFDISGMIAAVTVEQSFRNETGRWLEGVYAFPLPETAAVHHMEIVVGERRIVGEVREKEVAGKVYRAAKQAGRKAALVEQQRPNLFTNRVANIGPGEEISVRLEYVQTVEVSGDTFSLRLPTTITPRYMPGRPLAQAVQESEALTVNPYLGWAKPTDSVPDADAISPLLNPAPGSDRAPINPIEISARLDMGMPLARVESPYHDIAMTRTAGVYDIRLAAGTAEMDRDFVLSWRPVTGTAPAAALFTEQVGEEYFGLVMVVPPVADRATEPLPREIIFVVDTSGSMAGVSIRQARASMQRALQTLRPEDRFNIIAFDSSCRMLYRAPVPATRHYVQRAQEFVRQLDASGGTEMLPALQAALAGPADPDLYREEAPLRQVIFITDGAVGNERALFEEIAGRLGGSRLFTVGIGSAPNNWFMRKAAEFGRGSHTHIGDIGEVGEKMDRLFERLSRPAAVELAVDWPAEVEAWPERLPDLYLGQPLLVAARFSSGIPGGDVVVSGKTGNRPWQTRLRVAPGEQPGSGSGHSGVASLWARHKIAGLLDQLVDGRDPGEVRADVLEVALAHQLLSPYTSFVAVEEVVSRPPGEQSGKVPVANTRPRGQSSQNFAYPQGATSGPAQLWFGLLLIMAAVVVRALCGEEPDGAPLPRA